jgi:uncharacterized protein (DUF58 family)
MNAALQQEAGNLASLVPPLLLEAERIAQTVRQGVHGRRRTGVGETFWQFRDYTAGDPATRIDWRQSARTERLFVREREWEAAQNMYLWADASGSMRYASRKDIASKAERAQVLALALADLLLRGGEKAVWLAKEPISVSGRAALERIAAQVDVIGTSMPPKLPLARHAHILLCSDFLMPPDELRNLIQRYAAINLKGVLLHILDPAEEDFPFDGRLEMFGCEDEAPLLLPNAGALREAYRARMTEHKQTLMQYARSAGWFYVPHVTTSPAADALLRIYQSLSAERGS